MSKYNFLQNSNLVEESDQQDRFQYRIKNMHDPRQIYSDIFKGTSLEGTWRDSVINVPNIRDGDGRLIMPHEYRKKLKDGFFVMVNTYMKMYVFFFLIKKKGV